MVKKWPFERLLVTSKYKIKRSRIESPGNLSFSTAFWLGMVMQKQKNDHPRTTSSFMCFFLAAKNVLRPKRETKGLHGSCKIPFISDQKKSTSKSSTFHVRLGFMLILSSCKSSTIFWVWKWVEFPVLLEDVPICSFLRAFLKDFPATPRLFVELLFLKARVGDMKTWPSKSKKSVTISGKEGSWKVFPVIYTLFLGFPLGGWKSPEIHPWFRRQTAWAFFISLPKLLGPLIYSPEN